MTTYKTGNPLGSAAVKDLFDNAENLDHFENDRSNETWENRFGVPGKTRYGMEQEHDRQISSQEARFQQFLLSSGYVFLGDYQDGPFQFSARNQYIRYNNQYYRLNAATNVGFTTTGTTAASFANDVSHFVLIDGDTLRQELVSGGEGAGDALLAVKQPFPGSVLRTQHDKNAEFVSLDDAGGDRDSFDPESLELLVKAIASQLRIPYLGAQQFALPNQTLKVFNYLDGFKDRGAVVSFMNTASPDASEPDTQVLGLANAAALGKYADRDQVCVFAQMEGQPPLLTSTSTVFTANSVSSPDFAGIAAKLRKKQIIDVVDAANPTLLYSGMIIAFNSSTNTILVDTAWYVKGGNGITVGTPANNSQIKIVPSTKIWGANVNVMLKPSSDAITYAGFELGLYNNKNTFPTGYGYDAYSGGTYPAANGFQARGKLYCGFRNYSAGEFGFIGGGHTYGYYDTGSQRGLFTWNNVYGVNIKSPTSYALIVQDSANGFITGMDANGAWQGMKEYSTTTSIGSTVSSYATITYATPAVSGDAIVLPSPNAYKKLTVKNLSLSNDLKLTGPFEFGGSGITVTAKCAVTLHAADGVRWYVISKYIP